MNKILEKKYKHVSDDEKSDVLFAHKQGMSAPSIAATTGIKVSRVRYIIKYYKPKTFIQKLCYTLGIFCG